MWFQRYIEANKAHLYNFDGGTPSSVAQAVLLYVFENVLKLLHPFMPYVTEELWQTKSPSKAAGMFSGTQDKCATCGKTAYPLEKEGPVDQDCKVVMEPELSIQVASRSSCSNTSRVAYALDLICFL